MRKPTQNFVVDATALILFVLLTGTGFVMHFTLPPGTHGSTVWGLGRHDWGALHFWIALGLLATIVLHLILHWRWVVHMVRGRKAQTAARVRVMIGLAAALALLMLALAPLLSPKKTNVESESHETTETRSGRSEGHSP